MSGKRPYANFLFILQMLIMMSIMSGCYYYKISSSSYPAGEDLSKVFVPEKKYIIHSGSLAFEVDNIKSENDSLKGTYVAYHSFPYKKSKFPPVNATQRYHKKKGEDQIYYEVHFYLQVPVVPGRELTTFAISDIYRYDIYSKDKLTTILASGAGIGLGIVFILSDLLHTTGNPF